MCTNFVLLADGTTSDKVIDENRKSQPPKIMFDNGFGAKSSEVAQEGGRMDGVK